MMNDIFKIDFLLTYGSGLMIPKLIFELATATSEYGGAAAITSRLKDISFDIGMEEGIGVFVLMGIISYKSVDYLVEKFYQEKIEKYRLEERVGTTDAVLIHIDTYPITKYLKKKLKIKYALPK
jgi:hypothetical protein